MRVPLGDHDNAKVVEIGSWTATAYFKRSGIARCAVGHSDLCCCCNFLGGIACVSIPPKLGAAGFLTT